MWPPWGRPSRRALPSPAYFRPSFKDVYSLLTDDFSPALQRSSSILHRVRIATSSLRTWRSLPSRDPVPDENRIVVYCTSLRVVRKTFEDCRAVRSILHGFRVVVEERDLSMDSRFLNELKGILGKRQLTLPRVFIGGRYMGGAEEILQLHESGELKKYVEGVSPAAESGACECCGGMRFVLCQNCNGSRKFYSDKGGFRSCTLCNENGLVRCLKCCRRQVL